VELDDLLAGRGGRVVDGPLLDGPTVSRLFCDSAVHRVVMAGGSSVLDFGTSKRTIPAPLWSALVIRDETCLAPPSPHRLSRDRQGPLVTAPCLRFVRIGCIV